MPVPDPNDYDKYSDLKLDDTKRYFDLMKELKSKIKYHKEWRDLKEDTKCHRDPDIYGEVIKRPENWKSCFGQMKAAQTHLSNQLVEKNDLFLFFGLFKQTENDKDGKLRFKKNAPDLHIIFGYLQIGEIIRVKETKIPDWMLNHPHARNEDRKNNPTNRIYVARDNLSWDKNTSAAGVFKFKENLILTKKDSSSPTGYLPRSKWDLSSFFKDLKIRISYHSEKSWNPEGFFKSADIGQEFVIEDNPEVETWAKDLINHNRD